LKEEVGARVRRKFIWGKLIEKDRQKLEAKLGK
jgi:hypothetical protein